jgi:putative tricarboxylic transport membrane protein
VTRVLRTPEWAKEVKRYDWTPFVKTGAELDRFVASEQQRVHRVIEGLGIGQ